MVSAVRFERRGTGPKLKFEARDLWQGPPGDVEVKKVSDRTRLEWDREGDFRNHYQSCWVDQEVLMCRTPSPLGRGWSIRSWRQSASTSSPWS